MPYTTSTAAMTEPQCSYLTKLICTVFAGDASARAAALVEMMGMTKAQASGRIDVLKIAAKGKPWANTDVQGVVVPPAPAQTLAYDAPAGHYMVDGQHVWIKKGKYGGANVLDVAGKWYGSVTNQKSVAWLNEHLGSQSVALACVLEYAKTTSKCGVCNTKLTDPKSITAGIGPVCAKKYGYSI